MKSISKLIVTAICLFILGLIGPASAQKKADADQGDVTTLITPHNDNAIFSSQAGYTYTIKNTYGKNETGKVSYLVTDEDSKPLLKDSVHIKVGKNSSSSFNIVIPPLKTGFYKINFMINVADYDDTTKCVFGIRADEIASAHARPADFDQFWQKAKTELAAVKHDFKVTEMPEMEKNKHKVYKVEMKSLGGVTVRGYLTEPGDQPKFRKFPVLLGLPGYQVALFPIVGMDDDLAILTLDVRGQGISKDDLNVRKDDYIVTDIENKDKYLMRGVIMDCIRSIDFICSRPELRHDNIMVSGGSMGGYLAIATAGLDNRVTICSAQNPIMSDIYNLDGEVEWPIDHMKDYVKVKPGLTFQKVLSNLQYYDTKNFATTIKCPTLMGIGLLDPYVPPNNAYAVYNNIPAKKKIMVFRDLGHEVSLKYKLYEVNWMNDTFGLF